MSSPPLIPGRHPLLQLCEMPFVRHPACLLDHLKGLARHRDHGLDPPARQVRLHLCGVDGAEMPAGA
jgi:hypothetical protein